MPFALIIGRYRQFHEGMKAIWFMGFEEPQHMLDHEYGRSVFGNNRAEYDQLLHLEDGGLVNYAKERGWPIVVQPHMIPEECRGEFGVYRDDTGESEVQFWTMPPRPAPKTSAPPPSD